MEWRIYYWETQPKFLNLDLYSKDGVLLPPANEVREGYVFTGVCLVCPRGVGCLPHCMLRYTHPEQTSLRTRHPPPPEQTPPPAVHAGRYGQQAGGTHLTGKHTCSKFFFIRMKLTVRTNEFIFPIMYVTDRVKFCESLSIMWYFHISYTLKSTAIFWIILYHCYHLKLSFGAWETYLRLSLLFDLLLLLSRLLDLLLLGLRDRRRFLECERDRRRSLLRDLLRSLLLDLLDRSLLRLEEDYDFVFLDFSTLIWIVFA